MKITDIETIVCSDQAEFGDLGGGREVVLVKVHTDAGITGISYFPTLIASFGGHGRIAASIIAGPLKNILVGEDPLSIERLWEKMFNGTMRWGRRGITMHCIAALDIALWDLKGKVAGLPLYKLLGGYRDRVPVYANAAFHMPPDKLAAKAAEYVGQGFEAVKIRTARRAVTLEEATERVKAVREAVGPNIRIMCDCNCTWDADTAIRMLKKWEKYDIFWLEEPVMPDDIPGFAKIAANTGTAIAAGENHCYRSEFRDLITRGGVSIIQADAIRVGGITEWLKIAGMAAAWNIPVAPHNLQEVHVHLMGAFPIGLYIEFFAPENPLHGFLHHVIKQPPEIQRAEKSTIGVPQKPGLGFEFDEEVVARTRIA